MRIYILPAPPSLRPASQPFLYPAHNEDYGVEQDFLAHLEKRPDCITQDPRAADWHYLPVFWTRWNLNHDYARQGREELAGLVSKAMIDEDKTFTVCQYDDGPCIPLGRTTLCLASRSSDEGMDVPLLSSPHPQPWLPRRKSRLASFVGRLATHPIRAEMAQVLGGRKDVEIVDGDRGSRFFRRKTVSSRMVLAPRGYGGGSFRFFEAMQLGVPPVLISERDSRPFGRFLPWDSCSFYVRHAKDLPDLLDSTSPRTLQQMGEEASRIYREQLAFGRWGDLLLRDLETRR